MPKNLIISAIIITIVAAGAYFVITKKPQSGELKNKPANQEEVAANDCHKNGFIGPCPKEAKEKASVPTDKNAVNGKGSANAVEKSAPVVYNPQFIGLHYPMDSFTTTLLSISADGTYSKIYPQGDSYLELSGKWTYNKGVYDFVPDVENKELGFVKTQMSFPNWSWMLTNANDHEDQWYKVSDDPKFPGYSPIGKWTAETDFGTAKIELGGDWSFQYILNETSSTMKNEWWVREGDYIYDVDNWKRKSGIWDPLKAVPMIRIDTGKKKILFIDKDGDEIEMKRAE
ncbi:MAG: hypothetical protein WC949_00930 [Candidatus Paceibacterota bacterium]|jgi:hypothetical protein